MAEALLAPRLAHCASGWAPATPPSPREAPVCAVAIPAALSPRRILLGHNRTATVTGARPSVSAPNTPSPLPAQRVATRPTRSASVGARPNAGEPVCVYCILHANVRMKLTITGAEQRRFCRRCSREDPPPGARVCTSPLCREMFAPDEGAALFRCPKCSGRLYTKKL